MVSIDQSCSLQDVRRFLILSCCRSFIPEEYLKDQTVFPERVNGQGLVYTEAEDKITLASVRDVQFVKVENVVAVTYTSKSGLTRLRWERSESQKGRLKGMVTTNSILKLIDAGIITARTLRTQREQSKKTPQK